MSKSTVLVWGDPPDPGAPPVDPHLVADLRPCLVPGCDGDRVGRGLCTRHWTRAARGKPLVDADVEAVGIRRSGHGVYGIVIRAADGLPCYECGLWYRHLHPQHLLHKHAMTVADYRAAHGLPAKVPLMGTDLVQRLREATIAGLEADPERRARWEARRDDPQHRPGLLAAAAEATAARAPGARAAQSAGNTRAAATRRAAAGPRLCAWCHQPITVTRATRYHDYCSPACRSMIYARAARHREAARAGEPTDFDARPGTGERVLLSSIDARLGYASGTWRAYVHRGTRPPHDGRVDGERFWWASTLDPHW